MNLLILESLLLILLTLAQQIGQDIAVLQQQLHFRLTHQGHERDGMLWYCQTYTNWTKQLPFWNESKIKRLFIKLEKEWLVKINGQVKHVFCRSYKIVFNWVQCARCAFLCPRK